MITREELEKRADELTKRIKVCKVAKEEIYLRKEFFKVMKMIKALDDSDK